MKLRKPVSALVGLMSLALPVLADDASDSIKAAMEAYNSANYGKALEELNTAVQLVSQKQQEEMAKVCPKAPAGYTAEKPEGAVAGAALFGGGSTTTCRYNSSESSMSVEIVANSPMIQMAMMWIGNPALMASEPGSKLIKLGNEKAVQKFNEGSGEITIPLDGKILITVKGDSLKSVDPLLGLAQSVDLAAVRKVVNAQ